MASLGPISRTPYPTCFLFRPSGFEGQVARHLSHPPSPRLRRAFGGKGLFGWACRQCLDGVAGNTADRLGWQDVEGLPAAGRTGGARERWARGLARYGKSTPATPCSRIMCGTSM